MRALVLSGGGAKGAYEAGLISTLIHEYHEDFDIICGTSIGAINAAFLAQEKVDELTTMWQTIENRNIVTPYPRVQALRDTYAAFVSAHECGGLSHPLAVVTAFFKMLKMFPILHPLKAFATLTGALDPKPTQQLLAENLRLGDVKRILIATATDLTSQTEDVFYRFPERFAAYQQNFTEQNPCSQPFHDADFAETVRASGAIPGAFSPVTFASATLNASYVDGGVVNNTPIGLAIDAGATDITVVYLDPEPSKENVTPTALTIPSILMNCFGIMQQRLLALDHQLALQINDAIEASSGNSSGKKIVRLRAFRPAKVLAVGIIDFDKQVLINEAFLQGQGDARDAAQRNVFETTKQNNQIPTERYEGQAEGSLTKQAL